MSDAAHHGEKGVAAGGEGIYPSDTIDLLDYVEVVVKHRLGIICATLLAMLISAGAALLIPSTYIATAKILPPQQNSGLMGMMMGQMPNGMASLAGDLLGKGSPADQYVGMLASEGISDSIIDRFHLMQVYDQQYRADTYKKLDKNVDISAGKKDGIISIAVEDRDPQRAAGMANAYVEELDKLSVKLDTTDAGHDRAFLETRLVKAKADLARAEDELKAFQSKNKAVDIVEQAKGTIKGVADLEGQLAIEEVKLAGLKRVFADGSQEVKNQQSVLGGLRSQIAKFQGARSGAVVPGVASVPELGQRYVRLMREFKTQEALVEFLTKQDEMTKLTQAKTAAGVQIIQKARVPDKKAKPRRSLIVLGGTLAGACLSVIFYFLKESAARLSEEDRVRWKRMWVKQ